MAAHRDVFVKEVTTKLRELRKANGVTGEVLAERLGIAAQNLRRIEAGQNITLETLAKIARKLGHRVSISFEQASKASKRLSKVGPESFVFDLKDKVGKLSSVAVDSKLLKEFQALTEEIKADELALEAKRARRDRIGHVLTTGEAVENSESTEEAVRPTTWDYIGDDTSPKATREVLLALRDLGGRGSIAQIAERVKITEGALSLRLMRATKSGKVRRAGHGLYELPAPSTPTPQRARKPRGGGKKL